MNKTAADMRVMLLTPQYLTSGAVTIATELQHGWPVEWPEPLIVTPTKSGRASRQWVKSAAAMKHAAYTTGKPNAVGTVEDIIALARSDFDLVHVTDLDMPLSHRAWWYDLLQRLPIPWTLTLNGGSYDDIEWHRVLDSGKFIGVVWCTPGCVPKGLLNAKSHVRVVPLPRPYTLTSKIDAQLPRISHHSLPSGPIVGTHCRITPDKGIAALMALSHHIGVNTCVDGITPGVATPYTVTLQKHFCPDDKPVSPEMPWTTTRIPGIAHYNGAFSSGVSTAWYHTVHVSGTRFGLSGGHEYPLLEAIDAGCVIVQPTHMVEADCQLTQYTYTWERCGVASSLKQPNHELSRAVRDALAHSASWYDQSHNRRLIADYHNPEKLICAFFDELLTVI